MSDNRHDIGNGWWVRFLRLLADGTYAEIDSTPLPNEIEIPFSWEYGRWEDRNNAPMLGGDRRQKPDELPD